MKRCATCKIEKPAAEFFRCAPKPDGLQSECKQCQHERRKRRLATPEGRLKHYAAMGAWREANRDRYEASRRAWVASNMQTVTRWVRENRETFNALVRERNERERRELADQYVRRLLSVAVGCKSADVPQSLVDAKRSVIAAKRLIEEKQREITG